VKTLAAVIFIILMASISDSSDKAIKLINPEGLSKPTGYTHVVVTSGGRTVYIAGQECKSAVRYGGRKKLRNLKAQTERSVLVAQNTVR
jgi:hypothetical protein